MAKIVEGKHKSTPPGPQTQAASLKEQTFHFQEEKTKLKSGKEKLLIDSGM